MVHEIGHLILHLKLFEGRLDEKTNDDFSLSFGYNVSEMSSKRIELQANIFASHHLLPINTFSVYVVRYFNEQRIHKGYLYLDDQACNKQLVYSFLDKISKDFQVSWEVAKIRLSSLGLLKDDTDHSLRSILREMKTKWGI